MASLPTMTLFSVFQILYFYIVLKQRLFYKINPFFKFRMGIERIFIVSKSGGLIYSYDNQTPVRSTSLVDQSEFSKYSELLKSAN